VHENLDDGGHESWPVTREDLEPHYDAVQLMQQPQRFPLGAGRPYSTTRKTLAMLEAANKMKLPAMMPPLAVTFAASDGQPARPGEPFSDGSDNLHGAPRSTCRLCCECDLGCNYGAKNTLDFTYLSAAVRHSAQIRTCCEARTVARLDGGGYRIGYKQHLAARAGHPARLLDPTEDPRRSVTASDVVLAAGAVATPHLLLSNRAGLPGLSPALGTRASGNGDYLGWIRDCRLANGDGWRYLNPSRGPVITASISVSAEASASGREFLIQDAGAPDFADWMWQATEFPGDLLRTTGSLLRRLIDRLRGPRRTHASAIVEELLGDAHASAAMMPVLAMGRDVPGGRYRLEGSQLELDFDVSRSDEYYDGVRARLHELARELGGKFVADPLDLLGRAVSVHMVGGCPMSDDPRLGVVDAWGRVYGHPGLWIADGSVMPGPVGVNPSFTIAAMADRFADALLP
jgi:cholesterol oxidase